MIVFDIETTTTLDEIRMAGVYDTRHNTFELCLNEVELLCCIDGLSDQPWITWNGAAFDLPLVKKLWNIDMDSMVTWFDGMIYSRLVDFGRELGHSLASYGTSEISKGEVDYDHASLEELSAYLVDDLKLTASAWYQVRDAARKADFDVKDILKLEQEVAYSIALQGQRGIGFDTEQAEKTKYLLESVLNTIEKDVNPLLPSWDTPKSKLHWPPKIQFKKDGSVSKYLEDYCAKYGWTVTPMAAKKGDKRILLPIEQPLNKKSELTFSDQGRLKEYLLSLGWEPTWWNQKYVDGKKVKSSPRLTHPHTREPCPGLLKVGVEWGSDLCTWLTTRSRLKQLEGWIKAERRGFIHHSANTLGTPTGRFTHKLVVNVPRVGTPWGRDLRALFKPQHPDFKMVGWDAQALESVIEAHYCHKYDPGYAEVLTSGSSEDGTDIHTRNAELLDITRDMAKTFKYAITYGAGPTRLASTLGIPKHIAEDLYKDFWEINLALRQVRDRAIAIWKRTGYIPGLDGRRIQCRNEHSVLNYLFQSGGAIVMKHAMLLAEHMAKDLPAFRVLAYHDEEQWVCLEDKADKLGMVGVQSIEMAGQHLLRVPLTGEYKIGESWADTH